MPIVTIRSRPILWLFGWRKYPEYVRVHTGLCAFWFWRHLNGHHQEVD